MALDRSSGRSAVTAMAKGANVKLNASALRVTLTWSAGANVPDVDISALLLRATGKVASDDDMVFYNQPAHPSGGARHAPKEGPPQRSDALHLDLDSVPSAIERIVVAASADGQPFGHVPGLILTVIDRSTDAVVATFDITGTSETAMLAGEVYRRDGAWKLRALGQGYDSGLRGIATDFGITVEDVAADEPAEPVQQSVSSSPPSAPSPQVERPTTSAATPPGVRVIPGRVRARKVNELGMRCNREDVPEPITDVPVLGTWQASADFVGVPEWSGHEATGMKLQTLTVAVTRHRLLGILSRFGVDEQIWFSVPRVELDVRTFGEQGTMRRRPAMIEISGVSWTARLTDVERLFSASDSYQSHQENSLLEALSTIAPEPEPVADVAVSDTGTWQQAPASGLFVQYRGHDRTGATCLVDPTAQLTAQTACLELLDWLPANILQLQFDKLVAGFEAPTSATPPGRLHSPVGFPTLAIAAPADPDDPDPAIRSYLWPNVDDNGAPVLDSGETTILQWTSDRPRAFWTDDELRPSLGGYLVNDTMAPEVSWTLTDRRLILVSRPALPPKPSSAMTQQDYSVMLGMVSPGLALVAASAKARQRARRAAERNAAMVATMPAVWGAMHLRWQWFSGITLEYYDHLKASKPNTQSATVVAGNPSGRRISIPVTTGRSLEPQSGPIIEALFAQVHAHQLPMGEMREQVHDNGRKGKLTRRHFPVAGMGFTVPESLLGL